MTFVCLAPIKLAYITNHWMTSFDCQSLHPLCILALLHIETRSLNYTDRLLHIASKRRYSRWWIIWHSTPLHHSTIKTTFKQKTKQELPNGFSCWIHHNMSRTMCYVLCQISTRLLYYGSCLSFVCSSLLIFSLNSIAKPLSLYHLSLVRHGPSWHYVTFNFSSKTS